MRSSSVAMYWMALSRRGARATGCWVAMTMKICSRICLKSSLRYWSCERTFSAAGPSRLRRASREASICDSTSVPIRTTVSRRLASSLSNVRRGMSALAEPAGDVRLCPRIVRCVEEIGRGGELDELSVAALRVHQNEGGEGGDACRLLHVVGDDHDRVVTGELDHQVFDLQRGHGVEGRAGLVHEDHLWAYRQASCDHQPLLLAAGKRGPRRVEAVGHLVPERSCLQASAHHVVDAAPAPAQQARTEGYVVADGHRKRAGPLEDHADLLAQVKELRRAHDVAAVEHHRALGARAGNQVVHAVEDAQQGCLAATGRPDDGRDPALRDLERDVLQRAGLSI